jgi:hypothetical protein
VLFWKDYRQAFEGRPPDPTIAGIWPARKGFGALALSNGGERLVSGADATLTLCAIDACKPDRNGPYVGRNGAMSARFSADGTRLVVITRPLIGTPESSAWIFAGGQSGEPAQLGRTIRAATFHPTRAETLITGGDDGIELWSLATGKRDAMLDQHPVTRLSLDRERGWLAAGLRDGELLVRRLDDATAPLQSGRRTSAANAVAFLSLPNWILRASASGLEAWNWPTDTWMTIDAASSSDVQSLPDGFALALSEGRAVLYDLNPARWIDLACGIVRRNLSATEWQARIGSAFPYECTCPDYPPGEGSGAGRCPEAGGR